MDKKDKLGFGDQIILVCRRKDGSIKWETDTKTDPIGKKGGSMAKTGMVNVASLLLTDIGGVAHDFIGIGTDNTAESEDHTDLQAVTDKKRKTAVGTLVQTTFANDTMQLVCTFAAADTLSGSWDVVEAGVFTAATAGIMLFRKIFTAKTCDWDAADTLEVTAKCQMKQGA